MSELSKPTKIALALAMPAGLVIAYWLYLRSRSCSSDKEDYCWGKVQEEITTSQTTKIKLDIPARAVGTIIGKQGAMIKKIQAETGAHLNFCDRTEEKIGRPRTLMISGTLETTQKAELMVHEIIAKMPIILTEGIQVPSYCVGRIIGKGGSTIRDLRHASGVRIDVAKQGGGTGPDEMKDITLIGSRQQIDTAIELIEEIVQKVELGKPGREGGSSFHKKFVLKEKESAKATNILVEEEDHWKTGRAVTSEELKSVDSDATLPGDFIQLMVSAVEHPGHFWVQMLGPTSLHLEQLQKDLTLQLTSGDLRKTLSVTDPQPGDMVAAKFEGDDPVYYRAKVIDVTKDGRVDLYFVDFGDNTYAKKECIFKLSPEFLSFPHQAIQCELAYVEPLNEKNWTDESITLFEDLVYCAQWKPLYAKVVNYSVIQGQGDHEEEEEETLRPCMRLVDTSGDKDVDIGEEMIRLGHARRSNSTTRNYSNVL